MTEPSSALLGEVRRFRAWAAAIPSEHRTGEWECDYDGWTSLRAALLDFAAARPFDAWSADELDAVLYALARDNETQQIAGELRVRHPGIIPPLTRTAIERGEADARWQLAMELAHLGGPTAEPLLLELAGDAHEYVRRQALHSLARIRSPAAERVALHAWHRPDVHQQWARMMALWALHTRGSPHLPPLLDEAARDERPYLRAYAERILRGEPLD